MIQVIQKCMQKRWKKEGKGQCLQSEKVFPNASHPLLPTYLGFFPRCTQGNGSLPRIKVTGYLPDASLVWDRVKAGTLSGSWWYPEGLVQCLALSKYW